MKHNFCKAPTLALISVLSFSVFGYDSFNCLHAVVVATAHIQTNISRIRFLLIYCPTVTEANAKPHVKTKAKKQKQN